MLVLTSKDRALPPLADALLFLVIFIHQVFSIFGNFLEQSKKLLDNKYDNGLKDKSKMHFLS